MSNKEAVVYHSLKNTQLRKAFETSELSNNCLIDMYFLHCWQVKKNLRICGFLFTTRQVLKHKQFYTSHPKDLPRAKINYVCNRMTCLRFIDIWRILCLGFFFFYSIVNVNEAFCISYSANSLKEGTNLPIRDPVGWSCRIHRLHLCTGVRLPHWMSCIWH